MSAVRQCPQCGAWVSAMFSCCPTCRKDTLPMKASNPTMAEPLTDTDYIEAHVLARMLADDPSNRRLQEAAWALVGRLRREGKISDTDETE